MDAAPESTQTEPVGAVDLLLVAAHMPELSPLQDTLGASMVGELGGVKVLARSVGIGVVAATLGTAEALTQCPAPAVVLLGSCGLYPGVDSTTTRFVVPEEIRLLDRALVTEQAALPGPMHGRLETDPGLSAGLVSAADGYVGDLATTLGITTDDRLAAELAKRAGCVAENLEAFGVALACAQRGVRFATLLGVTNQVGSQGREQWAARHQAVSIATIHCVREWLGSGAAGL